MKRRREAKTSRREEAEERRRADIKRSAGSKSPLWESPFRQKPPIGVNFPAKAPYGSRTHDFFASGGACGGPWPTLPPRGKALS